MDSQNEYLWGGHFFGVTNSYTVSEECTFDDQLLAATLEAFPEFQADNYTEAVNAHMELGEDGQFAIVPESYGTQLAEEDICSVLAEQIAAKSQEVSLDERYFVLPTVYSDDAELNAEVEANNSFLSTKLTLTLHDGSEYVIDGETLKDWLAVREDDPSYYYVDEAYLQEKATEAAAAIAELDDFSSTTVSFKSTTRGTINLWHKAYGCTVDQEAEAAQICEDIKTGGEIERTPVYSEEYTDPIGDTYAEVDIKNQMVYMYVNGELVVKSSCVSGLENDPERRSDHGLFYVTRRHTDYTMKGEIDPETGEPSYTSFVYFAVFYNGGEALHDASWRSTFGGSIYLNNGSHGCINLPYSAAKTIYLNSYVGMPVIVF